MRSSASQEAVPPAPAMFAKVAEFATFGLVPERCQTDFPVPIRMRHPGPLPVNLKMVPIPSLRKFNIFNIFNTFNIFNAAQEHPRWEHSQVLGDSPCG